MANPRGIWPLSNNEIWLASGSVFYYNGDTTTIAWPKPFGINTPSAEHIWAYNDDNIFFAGHQGNILHYNDGEFIEMETNTTIDIIDIWGTNLNNIWAIGRDSGNSETIVLKFNGEFWETYYYWNWGITVGESNLNGMFHSVWTYEDWVFLCGWGGVWSNQPDIDDEWEYTPLLNYQAERIRGNHLNDIYIFYVMRAMWHYNGESWVDLNTTNHETISRPALTLLPNMVIAGGLTGQISSNGVIIKGIRENE